MTKYCGNCGKPNEKDAAFCYDCGTRFEAETVVGPSLGGAFGYCMKNYFKVGGRATRAEYWGWLVVYCVISALFAVAAALIVKRGLPASCLKGTLIAFAAWAALTLIPGLTVATRRLHDTNKTGWRLWIPVVLLVGGCVAAFYSVSGGDWKIDAGKLQDASLVKNAILDYARTLKGLKGLATVDYVALAGGALGALSALLLALRLCFVRGTQEANRYGDQQVNP